MLPFKKRGNSYYTYWQVQGRKHWESLGQDEELARHKWAEHMEARRGQKYGHAPNPGRFSWKMFCKRYLEFGADKSEQSLDRDRITIDKFNSLYKVETLFDLKPMQLSGYIKHRKAAGIKESTINRDLNTLKAMSKQAKEWGLIKEDPWQFIKKFTIEYPEPVPFTAHEIKNIREMCYDEFERALLSVGWLQGFRTGEIANLKWSDLDFEADTITIQLIPGTRPNPKKKARILTLHPDVKRDLLKLKKTASDDYVFGEHQPKYLSDVFKRILTRAGVSEGRLYTLRHTFCSNLANSGTTDLNTLRDLMGHRRIATTQKYLHTNEALKEAAIKSQPGYSGSKTVAK